MYKKSNGPKLISEGPPVLQFPRQKNNLEHNLYLTSLLVLYY